MSLEYRASLKLPSPWIPLQLPPGDTGHPGLASLEACSYLQDLQQLVLPSMQIWYLLDTVLLRS